MNETKLASVTIPKADAIEFLMNKRPSASFVSIIGYRSKGTKELADHQIIMNVSYERMLKESLVVLKTIDSVNVDVGYGDETLTKKDEVFKNAKNEIELAIRQSLAKENDRANAMAEHFIPISKGVRIHKETQEIHISGKPHQKTVREAGTIKIVKSRPKTIVKNAIRSQLPHTKWVQFSLGYRIEIDDEGREIRKANFEALKLETEKFTTGDFYESI